MGLFCALVLEVVFSHSSLVMHLELRVIIALLQIKGRNTLSNRDKLCLYLSDDEWFQEGNLCQMPTKELNSGFLGTMKLNHLLCIEVHARSFAI